MQVIFIFVLNIADVARLDIVEHLLLSVKPLKIVQTLHRAVEPLQLLLWSIAPSRIQPFELPDALRNMVAGIWWSSLQAEFTAWMLKPCFITILGDVEIGHIYGELHLAGWQLHVTSHQRHFLFLYQIMLVNILSILYYIGRVKLLLYNLKLEFYNKYR